MLQVFLPPWVHSFIASFAGSSSSSWSLKLLVCCAQSLGFISFSVYTHLDLPISWLYSPICMLPNPKFIGPSWTCRQMQAFVLNCLLVFPACMSNRYLRLSMSETEFPILLPIFSLPTLFVFVNGRSLTVCLYQNHSNHPWLLFFSHILCLMY